MLRFAEGAIAVEGKQEAFTIPVAALRSVEVFRLHGTGRMIRIVHGESTLYVSVVRFCIAGRFAVINFFKTAALARRLSSTATA